MITRIGLILLISLLCTSQLYCEDKTPSKPIYTAVDTSGKKSLTPFSIDDAKRKIIKRTNLEREGRIFAKQGLYEEALEKYKAALDSSLINYEHEKSTSRGAIREIYKRQDKFEEALQIINENIKKHPNEYAVRERLEILSFINARNTKSNKPIYNHIDYLKTKYSNFFPPNGYAVGESDILINKIIHLYDYLCDYDTGIAFMNEIIKYHTNHKDPNHRSAHKKDVAEYTRVKEAWELDKKTGKHGHLREVIKTSDVISW